MTLAQWFTHYEHGGFPIKKAALGSCDLSQSCMSAAKGTRRCQFGSSGPVMAMARSLEWP